MKSSHFDVRDTSVLITGGASGIGLAMARQLLDRGAWVTLVDLHHDALDAAAASLASANVFTAAADVTDYDRMVEVVEEVVARAGRLDVVVANAGVAQDPPTTLAAADLTDYERVIEIDLLGVVRTVKAALPHVLENQGHVLITASIYSFANGVINSAYALSKAAVESLGRSLRLELAPFGASAGTLHPGWVRTPLTGVVRGENPTVTEFKSLVFKGPLGRVIEPEEVARAAVRSIETRSPKVIVPKVYSPYSALRGLMNAGLDRYLESDATVLDIIRRIDREAREHYAAREAR